MFTHKYDVRWYVDRRVDKRLDARLDKHMKDVYTTTLKRIAETDQATQEILQRHRDQLDDRLSRRANVLLNDAVVRANLLAAVEHTNERRLQQLEAKYARDVRVAQCMAGAACLGVLAFLGVGFAAHHRGDN
jgi:hypothetical protein